MLEKDGRIYYVGDRWGGNGEKYFTSTYVVLEVRFDADGKPYMDWCEDAGIL